MSAAAVRSRADQNRLQLEREQTVAKLDSLRLEMRNTAEPTADEADIDSYEREKTWALMQSLQRKLESIERALQSTKTGTYGICEACRERIDPARLDILPEATLCLKCQREIERSSRRSRA